MSCFQPWEIKTDKWNPQTHSYYSYVPCGWCLNCRVDKANELTHRCEYELINYKCGAFVTLTYDDYHITHLLRNDKENNPVATLSRSDLKHFMYRLRANIKNKMPDNLLSNHHFKFLAVGEYGGQGQVFDRPHLHILLFGLDFAVCKKNILRSWQGRGNIKCEPILQGGIRYVLKYLDKQLFGSVAKQKYDDNNLERPFQTHSLGLGQNLYKDQLNYIKNHNNCYHWKGHDVPVPTYYKNKYYLPATPNKILIANQYKKYRLINGNSNCSFYDLHEFNIRQNLLRAKNINAQNALHGKPVILPEFVTGHIKRKYADSYIHNLAIEAQNIAVGVPF